MYKKDYFNMTAPKRVPILATVTDVRDISPSIRRLKLKSSNAEQFTALSEGHYFKFLFNLNGETDISSLSDKQKPIMRTYTIREYDSHSGEITVDIVRHITKDMQCGFASRWAESTTIGETISLIGPGSSPYPNFDRDGAIFVADMTSLPALAAVIKKMPTETLGDAFIEIASETDIQQLNAPQGLSIHWVITNKAQNLIDTVRNASWPKGNIDVWCACEFDSMKALRHYFRNEKSIEKDHIYISSYWKQGVSEDGHKVLKRKDQENMQ